MRGRFSLRKIIINERREDYKGFTAGERAVFFCAGYLLFFKY